MPQLEERPGVLEGLQDLVKHALAELIGEVFASAAHGARSRRAEPGREPRCPEAVAVRKPARPPHTGGSRTPEAATATAQAPGRSGPGPPAAPEAGRSSNAVGPGQSPDGSPRASRGGLVSLDVGGKEFVVPVATLRGDGHPDESVRSSLLAAVVSGRWRGPVRIGRPPWAFPFVLEYLQNHKLINYPDSHWLFLMLESDADFLGLIDLRRRLHVRLSTYLSCSSTADGRWKWYDRASTINQALSVGPDGSTLTVHADGVYLVSARDQQDRRDGPRSTELRTSRHDPAAACSFTSDGPVSASVTRVWPLARGDTISFCSERPCPRYPYCALLAVRLDPSMPFGTWEAVAYGVAWCWNATAGSLSPWVDENTWDTVLVGKAGRYVVSTCDNQGVFGSRAICVKVNSAPVARSRTNTGTEEVNSPSTAVLTQLLELAEGDRLSVSSDRPQHDEGAALMMLGLPDGMSSASWEATSAEDVVPLWSAELLGHPDYLVVSGGRQVRIAKGGYHLVMLRTAHDGDRAEVLQMWHNEEVVAASHVTTDGKNVNCSQLLEVVHAKAGDTVSAVCQSFTTCDEQLLSNLSVVFLRGD